MIRLYPDRLGMILHSSLYDRLLQFAQRYTPEIPSEPIVHSWLQRFYSGDPCIIILIELNDYKIISHGFIEIMQVPGDIRILMVHQFEHDTKKTEHVDAGMELIDKLTSETGSHCSCMMVTKNVKVYEKKYGYRNARICMVKSNASLNDMMPGDNKS